LSLKKNLLLFLSLIIGIAVTYKFDYLAGNQKQEAKEEAKKILSFKPEDVQKLIFYKNSQSVTVERNKTDWEISNPFKTEGDGALIESIIHTLALSSRGEVIAKKNGDLSPYGLKTPKTKIAVILHTGKKVELAVGDSLPTGKMVYAISSKFDTVFSVKKELLNLLSKNLFDLREKRIYKGKHFAVTSIEYKIGIDFYKVAKEDGKWIFKDGRQGNVNETVIKEVAEAVFKAKAIFLPGEWFDGDIRGLSPAKGILKLTGEKKNITLLVGDYDFTHEGFFVKNRDSGMVGVLDLSFFKTLQRSAKKILLAKEKVKKESGNE